MKLSAVEITGVNFIFQIVDRCVDVPVTDFMNLIGYILVEARRRRFSRVNILINVATCLEFDLDDGLRLRQFVENVLPNDLIFACSLYFDFRPRGLLRGVCRFEDICVIRFR